MADLRVAVIGARPPMEGSKPSMGYYHVREFMNAGADVVAIMASDNETRSRAYVEAINKALDVNAAPYHDLEQMLKEVKPDAVSICSPTEFHILQVSAALDSGINVLCEKPMYDKDRNPFSLFRQASEKGLVLTVNTQLVFLVDKYLELYRRIRGEDPDYRTFEFETITHGKGSGLSIPIDLLPHPLSILLKFCPPERIGVYQIKNPLISENSSSVELSLYSDYRNINAKISLGKDSDPKHGLTRFGLDGFYVARKTGIEDGKFVNYLVSAEDPELFKPEPVADPLAVSVSSFCDAVRFMKGFPLEQKNVGPLITPDEALLNIRLQTEIMNSLQNLYKP